MTTGRRTNSSEDRGNSPDYCADISSEGQGVSGSSPLLAKTIEGEIIPRLMMTFSVLPSPLQPDQEHGLTGLLSNSQDTTEELVQLLLNHDASVSVEYLQVLRDKGASLKDLYLELLAPAARMLGVMWDEDEANFAEVTIGVSRLHQILLQFSPLFCANATEHAGPGHTAAIFALPGETHTFGIFMVVEFFRRAGWNVFSGSLGNDAEACQLLSTQDIDLLGISVSGETHLDELPERIALLKSHSRNKKLNILVGGQVFMHNPGLAREVGADGSATDGQQAVQLAESMLEAQSPKRPHIS